MIAEIIQFVGIDVWQFDRPVVRQLHFAPGGVVESPRHAEQFARLAELGCLIATVAEAEILCQIIGVTEVKSPPGVQAQSFTGRGVDGFPTVDDVRQHAGDGGCRRRFQQLAA